MSKSDATIDVVSQPVGKSSKRAHMSHKHQNKTTLTGEQQDGLAHGKPCQTQAPARQSGAAWRKAPGGQRPQRRWLSEKALEGSVHVVLHRSS